MSGFVYFIGNSTFGWYKIGKSITPEVRIKDLGILLPFKIKIVGVWSANNHHLMEKTLHEIYATSRINGEWFEFSVKEAQAVFDSIPPNTRIYPTIDSNYSLDKFSNIIEDTKKSKRITGVKVQKLRGNFTPEEREEKRQLAIKSHKEKHEKLIL